MISFSEMINRILSLLNQIIGRNKAETPVGLKDAAVSYEMINAVERWGAMYFDRAPWVDGKNVFSGNYAAAICSELARLVTLEMETGIEGSPRAEFLDREYKEFLRNIRTYVEYACAFGGVVFKPYPVKTGFCFDVIRQDEFCPFSADSAGNITGAVFTEKIHRNRKYYSRLEWHSYNDGIYTVINQAFVSDSEKGLGVPCELSQVYEWSGLMPKAEISGVERPLFVYFKIPFGNSVDADSALGASVFAKCEDIIRQADLQYSRLLWEYRGGQLAVDAPSDILRTKDTGKYEMPEYNDRLFRRLDVMDSEDRSFYEVFNPTLRDNSYLGGLNKLLRMIEFNTGLAYGTLSDVQAVDKTAEEIKASKQRSYTTVSTLQKALEEALRHLVYSMDVLATLYRLAPEGKYNMSFNWDDSIISDKDKEREQDRQDMQDGILAKWEYRMKYFGETAEKAKAAISAIQSEAPSDDELLGFASEEFGGDG